MNSIAVNSHHKETEQRQYKREVCCWHTHYSALVDDHCLQRRQNRTTKNGHDESCCTKLGIVAQSVECYTVDSREHKRHATANANQTV